jgi:FMN phosphatase YigB (HAD superfamily)
MTTPELLVLFDVDNTLLDNDAFAADLDRCLQQRIGDAGRERYWQAYESLRAWYGYVDYLGTLQRLRDEGLDTAALAQIAAYLLDYPFVERLYPGALAAVAHVAALAPVAILSDGDVVFQPRKIRSSGLQQAFDGKALLCVHKDQQVEELLAHFPARHYALVDDKPVLLERMKSRLGNRLTTIWVRQGHYAREADATQLRPAPDRSIDAIAQLCELQSSDFHAGASAPATT